MEIESLEFWETVKKEYNFNYDYQICASSNTFKYVWNDDDSTNKKVIRNLATQFIIKKTLNVKIGTMWLFLNNSDDFCRTKIRIDFINWCINKFKNK